MSQEFFYARAKRGLSLEVNLNPRPYHQKHGVVIEKVAQASMQWKLHLRIGIDGVERNHRQYPQVFVIGIIREATERIQGQKAPTNFPRAQLIDTARLVETRLHQSRSTDPSEITNARSVESLG